MADSTNGAVPLGTPMNGYVLYGYEINDLLGRLLTLIESFGMRETQEKAVKDLVRQEVYVLYRCQQVAGEFLNEAVKNTQDAGVGWQGVETGTGRLR